MIIKVEHGGKSFAYDDETITVLQGIAVEDHIKGTLMDYDQGLGSQRTSCFQALGWLIFHDGDPKVPIAEVDFPLIKLSTAWLKARLGLIDELKARLDAEPDAGPAKAGSADPTGGPGSAPRSGSTSGRSRRSSGTDPQTSTPSA